MAEVNIRSWPEISQAADGSQLNSTYAMMEQILATMARLESKLDERNQRLGITIPPPRPEPDPPDGPSLYAANQPYQFYTPQSYMPEPTQIYQPYQPPSSLYQPYATFDVAYTAFEPPPYVALDTHLGYHTGQREFQPTPPPYQPSRPSCWHPPAPALEKPFSYTDSWQSEDRPFGSLPPPDRQLPQPSWLPSCCSLAAAVVRQPQQLRSSHFGGDMPRQHVQNPAPTYTVSAIAPTKTTQGHSCHEHSAVVRQPLLIPTSHCCSALTPMVVATVPILPPPPPSQIHCSSTVQPLADAPLHVDVSEQPSQLHLPSSMKEYKPKTCEVHIHQGDNVRVRYKGGLTYGTIFDSSFERGDPVEFELGSGHVITVWDGRLLGMCLGEKRKLKSPSKLSSGKHVFDPG